MREPVPPDTGPAWLWAKIKRHKVLGWTVAYSALAYALQHGVQMLSDAHEWPHGIVRMLSLGLVLGVPIVATMAWFRGQRTQHPVSGAEIAILALSLFASGSLLWWLASALGEKVVTAGSSREGAMTGNVTIVSANSIAVLPFRDLSEKRDQEYFSDGMAEEILNLLAKIPELKVIGRTSSFQFKGKAGDLRKIGAALGAANVLEGSVRRSDDRIHVAAQLIESRGGAHLWSATYDGDASDVLSVQEDIATHVVRALQLRVDPSYFAQSRASLRNSEAYESYLRGLHALDRFDQRGFEEAIADFRRALELDPSFVAAAEALALALRDLADFGFVPAQSGWEQARAAAQDALKLDSKSAIAHAMLGNIYTEYDWNWPAAERELKGAVALARNNPSVLIRAAEERLAVGQWSEAAHLLDAAGSADPLDATVFLVRGWTYVPMGRLAEAERAARRMLEIAPAYGWGHYYLGLTLLIAGKPEAALAEMQKEATSIGGQLVGLAAIYHALHRTQEADAALAHLEAEYADYMPMGIADVYAFRGENDRAFEWLDKAYAQKDAGLYLIKSDPLLKSVEADPRYKAFLRRMNLPQ